MDSVKGAIALRKYIQERNDGGCVDPEPENPSAEPSPLSNVHAWADAFHKPDTASAPD
jgi:hypothetical protein